MLRNASVFHRELFLSGSEVDLRTADVIPEARDLSDNIGILVRIRAIIMNIVLTLSLLYTAEVTSTNLQQ